MISSFVSLAVQQSQAAEHDFPTPLRQLFLEKQDWKLWQPRKEYFIIYDLMQWHETLSDELRSAFYNSWDVGFLYLEAKFTNLGISSLREVLCKYSNLKLSSIAVVPKADLQRCLTLAYDSQAAQQVFAGRQWVQIKQGLYQGDIGLVLKDFQDGDSSTGVRVFIIPQLDFTNEDHPSTSK
ncbi:hypothetical protein BT96DRAFT_991328 [Gymnopus androsaceus JB14]|uniref:Uncharacterized protein n=1 Tax=Gymnopus androsaceus JB14 TaxID=1447944 RepID=A0A6A4HV67_9AGAR|nr:hypothetical protein BT96DRAFT_991328 [Gymnopus androsaceus JB14]